MYPAELRTALFRECVAEREGGLPHLDITDAMYEEFGKATAAPLEKIGQQDPEPYGTEDRTLYRVWLGIKTHAYEPCPIEFDYYQDLAKMYWDCGQITQDEPDAYRTFGTAVSNPWSAVPSTRLPPWNALRPSSAISCSICRSMRAAYLRSKFFWRSGP